MTSVEFSCECAGESTPRTLEESRAALPPVFPAKPALLFKHSILFARFAPKSRNLVADSQLNLSMGRYQLRRLTNIPGGKQVLMAREKADKSESKLDRANAERHSDRSKMPSSYDVGASREAAVNRDPAKESALSRAVQQIEKQFGKGSRS